MELKQYDLLVLGTGGAGYQVAMKCKEAGWSVAVVNDGPFGGTCSVRGCIPKKVLAGTAEIVDINRRLGEAGVVSEQPKMSWQELINFKRTFTDPVPKNTESSLRNAGIAVYTGNPRFVDNLTIEVGGTKLKGDNVHIAVGAKPAKLPIDGYEYMMISDDFLELDTLPKKIAFVGGGYVSFELAHIAARFGAEVTILHGDATPLAMFDADMVQELIQSSRDIDITVELDTQVASITRKDNTFSVRTKNGKEYETDAVVHGAGRPPAINELNLEATNVAYDAKTGVLVNDYLQSTSNPNVYAAGDAAAAGPPLSPVAGVQGGIVVKNLLGGNEKQPDYLSTPSVIFTTPTVARVGHNETSATEAGLNFDIISNDTSGWFDALRVKQKHSKSKIVVEKQTEKILGAHLIGGHAEDLINIFSLAVELGLTTEQLERPIMAFPTASDDMRSML